MEGLTEALKLWLPVKIVIKQVAVLLDVAIPNSRELPEAIELECASSAVNEGLAHLAYSVISGGARLSGVATPSLPGRRRHGSS